MNFAPAGKAVADSDDPPQGAESATAVGRRERSRDFDQALGARVRAVRIGCGMSQGKLGEALGISFQQVQKYEKGIDRIAASTLKEIADILGIDPGTLFTDTATPSGNLTDLREAMRMVVAWQSIPSPVVRAHLGQLIQKLGEPGASQPDTDEGAT